MAKFKWNDIIVQPHTHCSSKIFGKLTNDTQTALTHTVKAITEMTEFLLTKTSFKYMLSGNFRPLTWKHNLASILQRLNLP